MALNLDGMLNAAVLRDLAGEIVFRRSQPLVGLVKFDRLTNGSAKATVLDDPPVPVELRWGQSTMSGTCSCDNDRDGALCKHLTATGLAALDIGYEMSAIPPRQETPKPKPTRAGEHLMLVARNVTRLTKFTSGAATASYAGCINRLYEELLETLTEDTANEVAPVALYLATRLRKQLESRIDDSSGVIGTICQSCIDLYARACALGNPDPAKVGRWLAKFRLESPGWPDVTLEQFLPVLGDRGLKSYRRAVAMASDRSGGDLGFELHRMLIELADLDGDVDRAVELLTIGSPRYAAIIKRLIAAGLRADAIEWLDKAVAADRVHADNLAYWARVNDEYGVLPGVATSLYLDADRPDDALELARKLYHRAPNPEMFDVLVGAAEPLGHGKKEAQAAIVWVKEQPWPNADRVVVLLLHVGDDDGAWDAAERLGLASEWDSLVTKATPERIPAVLRLYGDRLDKALRRLTGQDGARMALRLIREVQRLIARVTGEVGGSPDAAEHFDRWIKGIRQRYRQRPALMRTLDEAKV